MFHPNKMESKNSNLTKTIVRGLILFVLTIFVAMIAVAGGARAADGGIYEGDGGDTGSTSTTCKTFPNGHTTLCGANGSMGGGVAWQVYSVGASGPVLGENGKAIVEDRTLTADYMSKTCKDIGASYYIAYGWVRNGNRGEANLLTAPIKPSNVNIQGAQYNTYGATRSAEEIFAAMSSGEFMDGVRLTENDNDRLVEIMREQYNATGHSGQLSRDTGFYCGYPGATYASQSQVWTGWNNDGNEYSNSANTGPQTENGQSGTVTVDTTRDVTLETAINVQQEIKARFSHNVLASKKDSQEHYWNVELTVDRDGDPIGRNEWKYYLKIDNGSEVQADLPFTGFGENGKYDDAYYYANTAKRLDGDGDKLFTFTKNFNISFIREGTYTICESITSENLTTKACARYSVGGPQYFASSAVVTNDCNVSPTWVRNVWRETISTDPLKTEDKKSENSSLQSSGFDGSGTYTCFDAKGESTGLVNIETEKKTAMVDNTDHPLIIDETRPFSYELGTENNKSTQADKDESPYTPGAKGGHSYSYTLVFRHNVYANQKNISDGKDTYTIKQVAPEDSEATDGFRNCTGTECKSSDGFVVSTLNTGDSIPATLVSQDVKVGQYSREFDENRINVNGGGGDNNGEDNGNSGKYYIPDKPDPAKSTDNGNMYIVTHVYNVKIYPEKDGKFILKDENGSPIDHKDYEFCEELSYNPTFNGTITDKNITTKACQKIRIGGKASESKSETVIEEGVTIGNAVPGPGGQVKIDNRQAFTGLVGRWRQSGNARDVKATINLVGSTSTTASVEFKFGVYGIGDGKTLSDSNTEIGYTISGTDGWEVSGVSFTGEPIESVSGMVSLNSDQAGSLLINGNRATAFSDQFCGWKSGTCKSLFLTQNSTISNRETSQNVAMNLRQVYDFTFDKTGTYKFCKTLKTDDGLSTSACAEFVVTKLEQGECSTYALEGYRDGQTNVLSKIHSTRLSDSDWRGTLNGGVAAGENDIIYATPADKIEWVGCYFPGAQIYAKEEVVTLNGETVGTHGADSGCGDTTNSYKTFENALPDVLNVKWANEFTAETTSPSGWNKTPSLNNINKIQYGNPTAVKTFGATFYGTLTNGNNEIREVKNERKLLQSDNNGLGDVGKTFHDYIWTNGHPNFASFNNEGRHPWTECCGSGCGYHGCCCCEKDYQHTNDYTTGTATIGKKESKTEVRVPYNYINQATVKITGAENDTVVYAGDSVTVSEAKVSVNPRTNNAVNKNVSTPVGPYATQVPNADARLIFYVTEQAPGYGETIVKDESEQYYKKNICDNGILGIIPYKNGDFCKDVYGFQSGILLNPTGDMGGEEQNAEIANKFANNQIYNIFDASAGDWFCAVVAIYPYRVSIDTALDDLSATEHWDGTKEWYVSPPDCRQIAKKPSFQIYGGSLFSNGSVATNFMRKSNLYGLSEYVPTGYNSATGTFYSPWAEESVIANGTVTGLASGAATGFVKNDRVWGADNNKYCEWTPLSIANNSCDNGTTGNAGVASKTSDREALVDFWKPTEDIPLINKFESGEDDAIFLPVASRRYTKGELNDPVKLESSPTGRTIYWYEAEGDKQIQGTDENDKVRPIPKDQTYVIKNTNGSITITSNIEYGSDPTKDSVKASAAIPKVIIYARNDIKISCWVTRIDAILISGNGKVNTCVDRNGNTPDINSTSRDNPLVINGTVIADSIELNRTYGAAISKWSGQAAEIINYDSSAILWGSFMSGAAESNTLVTTYQEELAPRY